MYLPVQADSEFVVEHVSSSRYLGFTHGQKVEQVIVQVDRQAGVYKKQDSSSLSSSAESPRVHFHVVGILRFMSLT